LEGEEMSAVSDNDRAVYFQRSYIAADGLWFMKIEEKDGFDLALEADREVWKVMPKIQARFLKSLLHQGDGLAALHECLTAKLDIEGYRHETRWEGEGSFFISITGCPWNDAMIKADRASLAGRIGHHICTTEYTVWSREFGGDVAFEMHDYLCSGACCCLLNFFEVSRNAPAPVADASVS
jgi:hypothetical protein